MVKWNVNQANTQSKAEYTLWEYFQSWIAYSDYGAKNTNLCRIQ